MLYLRCYIYIYIYINEAPICIINIEIFHVYCICILIRKLSGSTDDNTSIEYGYCAKLYKIFVILLTQIPLWNITWYNLVYIIRTVEFKKESINKFLMQCANMNIHAHIKRKLKCLCPFLTANSSYETYKHIYIAVYHWKH